MNIEYFKKIVFSLPKNSKILDAGCGKGIISFYIKKLRNDIKIYGMDMDASLKNKLPSFINFYHGSVDNIKMFKENYFDAIFCFHVIEHIDSPAKAINEFSRILKKHGKLIIETPHWISTVTPLGYNFYDDPSHKKPLSKNYLKVLLEPSFDIIKIKSDSPIYFHLKKQDAGLTNTLRNILNSIGFYKTVIWTEARKR